MVKNTMFKSNSFSRINKFVLVTLLFIVMVGFVSSADVAYVVKDEARVQKNIIDSFSEMGLTYEVVEDSQINSKTNFAQYEVILIDDHLFNLRNTVKYIDISKYKTIITNPYEGEEYGLTDKDGISSLTSNNPLSVVKGNSIIQVYNSAYDVRRRAISYYYLGKYNKAEGFMSIATPYKGGSEVLGDVISIAMPGVRLSTGKITQEKICFFGISESKYWTPAAKKLFKDECLGFVAFEIECYQDSDCNDNDDYTKDVCNNPGEYTSYCENIQIECLSDNDCGVDGFIGGEFCTEAGDVGKEYRDYSCLNAGTTSSSCVFDDEIKVVEQCSELCSEGQCVSVTCNENIDCGVDGFVGSEMCTISGDVGKEYISYLCNNPGTLQSSCSNETELRTIEECSYGCVGGVCEQPPIECSTNLDCGEVSYEGNYCSQKDVIREVTTPTCKQAGTSESYCEDVISYETIEQCSQECSNGVCVDNRIHDISVLDIIFERHGIGVGNILVRNKDYNMTSVLLNLGGFDESVELINNVSSNNQLFKSGQETVGITVSETKDVKSLFKTDIQNGYYDVSVLGKIENDNNLNDNLVVEEILVTECINNNDCSVGYLCKNGGTINAKCEQQIIQCRNDAECDDGSDYTVDRCVNPGTTSSFCRHTEVNCVYNTDCGETGFVGGEYCSEDGVYKNYQTAICKYPATLDSHCQVSVDQISINQCEYACSEDGSIASCIRCDENLDCNDGNDNTIDRCVNPGSVESYCKNELDLGNVVNIIDSDVSGDACGVVKVSCKTDLPTDYIQLYYDVNAIDSRFVKKEIKEEYTYYEWEILVNAPLMEEKTYEIGCLLNVSIPGNDLSPIRPYPGDAIGEGSLQGKICSNIPPVCGFDEHAEFILSTTIEPTNEEYVIPQQIDDPTLDIINVISQGKVSNLVNGFNLNEGDYIAQITDGAISRWSNDSQDTTSWGGGEGLTWEGVANVAYQDGNNVNNIRFGSIWKSLPSEARDSARGKYVRFDHTGGEIYVYMDDSYIEDNRGSLEVSIYECVEN
jgi:hypothetical protein